MAQQFCTQHYGTGQRLSEAQAFARKRLSEIESDKSAAGLSYTVVGSRQVMSRKDGLTGDEIRNASEAVHWLKGLRLNLWSATLSDRYRPEREIRDLIRDFKSDLAREQQRAGMVACYYVEILEGEPAVHSNILFPLGGPHARRRIAGLLRSAKYQGEGDVLVIEDAGNANGWLAYCSKERVTQARWVGGVGNLAKRLLGSHRLGAGGGDRLRLSKALSAQLLGAALIQPYRRIYAARGLAPAVVREPDPHGLFGPLPDKARPSKDWVRSGAYRPKLAIPGQYALGLERRPTAIDLMLKLGPTHAAIAERVGLSRPQITNVINGQFGASRRVVRRVLELARAA